MILAHAARRFNPFHTIEGMAALDGLRMAVTEAKAFEPSSSISATTVRGYPVSYQRGLCGSASGKFDPEQERVGFQLSGFRRGAWLPAGSRCCRQDSIGRFYRESPAFLAPLVVSGLGVSEGQYPRISSFQRL